MFNLFRKKNKRFSTVTQITRIKRIYTPENDKTLELLFFDDCDYPCVNWYGYTFREGDLVQLFPMKLN